MRSAIDFLGKALVIVLMSVGFLHLALESVGPDWHALAMTVVVSGILGHKVLFSEWR